MKITKAEIVKCYEILAKENPGWAADRIAQLERELAQAEKIARVWERAAWAATWKGTTAHAKGGGI